MREESVPLVAPPSPSGFLLAGGGLYYIAGMPTRMKGSLNKALLKGKYIRKYTVYRIPFAMCRKDALNKMEEIMANDENGNDNDNMRSQNKSFGCPSKL